MKSVSFIIGFILALVLIIAVQGAVIMTATAFLATELGFGAALSYADSLVFAVIIDVAQIVFSKPRAELK